VEVLGDVLLSLLRLCRSRLVHSILSLDVELVCRYSLLLLLLLIFDNVACRSYYSRTQKKTAS
jgi:hypothetical protein